MATPGRGCRSVSTTRPISAVRASSSTVSVPDTAARIVPFTPGPVPVTVNGSDCRTAAVGAARTTSVADCPTAIAAGEKVAVRPSGRPLITRSTRPDPLLRWREEDGLVSVFRSPSNNSNGNTFDFQGRQLSCEHLTRRVVRYENDGAVTVIADSYNGKRLNSPNDVVAHPDGSYWFTDPPYGGQLYEGAPDAPGGPSNSAGRLKPRLGP